MVGSIALALILFDGGLRTRFATFRSVLGAGDCARDRRRLLTAALTAPVAKYMLGMNWTEALLVGAVVASTDAAAVFFLIHAAGCGCARASARRSRSNPAATIRSRCCSPSCSVEFLLIGER